MIKWLKNRLGITALEKENERLRRMVQVHRAFVSEKIAELKDYTVVDADVGFRGNNTIVLTGVYRRKAYVRFYDIGDGEFLHLLERLEQMRGNALIRHIDAPPNFHGTFDL